MNNTSTTRQGDDPTRHDDDLLKRWRAGDRRAGAELYQRHHDDARGYARRLARGVGDPDDVVAEAFAKVLGAMRRGQGPRDGFRRYLFTAVRSCAFDAHRVHVTMAHEVPDGREDERFDDILASGSPMLSALSELPERSRQVLWLLEVEGWSVSEVAKMTATTPGAVSALAYRSRTQLRRRYLAMVPVEDTPVRLRAPAEPVIDLRDEPVIDLRDDPSLELTTAGVG